MMIGDMRRKQQRKKSKLEIKIVLATARVANCINSIKRKRYSLFNYLFEIIFLLIKEEKRKTKLILALAIQ